MTTEDLAVENERLRAENAALRRALDDRSAGREVGLALAAVGARLGPVPDGELDAAIGDALGIIARAIGADRAVVVLFGRVSGYERTHVWHADGAPRMESPARRQDRDPFRALVLLTEPFVLARSTASEGGPDRELLDELGAQSVLVVPITSSRRPTGVVAFERLGAEPVYVAPVLALLRSVGDVFGSVLNRMRQAAEWQKLVECLLAFGPSPRDNIQRLTALVGELLGGLAATYDHLEDGQLRVWGRWRVPPALDETSAPNGRVCNEILARGGQDVVVLRDLESSPFAASDPSVLALGVATLVGRAIELDGRAVGALSVLFAEDLEPTPRDLRLLGAIANAVAVEELRAQAVAALVHSEESARVVFDHSLDGILVTGGGGPSGLVRSANPAACAMLGYEEGEMFGLDRAAMIDDPVRLPAFLAERARVGRARADLTFVRKDGATFTADVVSSSVVVAGAGSRNILILRDATERIRAADTLERGRALLAATLESTADGILAVDADRRVICHNKKFLAMWRVPDELATADEEARLLAHVPRLLDDPVAFLARVEEIYADPTGELLDEVSLADGSTFERYTIPLRLEGERVGRVWSFRDVTQRVRDKRREAELELEMRQAQKMEAVGRLAGGIAHDFNNLLTVISGYAAFVRDALSEGDELRADIVEIEQAARRAATLTRQLLAFSRRQVLLPKVFDLNGVVEGMTGMLERLLGEDVDVRTALDESLWSVKADPNQLEQVIVNLAVNARDAMPGGGVLRIATQNVLLERATAGLDGVPPGLYVRLDVGDTGVGMDEATRVRAFEPFFTTKEVGKGTGLGLSTVYGIVRQSGGGVDVESAPGEGTVFRILLPAVTESLDRLGPPSARPRASVGTETVLLVEDEEPVRRVAQKALTAAGYRVLEARDGVEALALLDARDEPIHLLLTDVVMPRMGGFELAEAVAMRRPGARLLFVSGHVDLGASGRTLPKGAELLEKPFRPDVLLERVRAVLDD